MFTQNLRRKTTSQNFPIELFCLKGFAFKPLLKDFRKVLRKAFAIVFHDLASKVPSQRPLSLYTSVEFHIHRMSMHVSHVFDLRAIWEIDGKAVMEPRNWDVSCDDLHHGFWLDAGRRSACTIYVTVVKYWSTLTVTRVTSQYSQAVQYCKVV